SFEVLEVVLARVDQRNGDPCPVRRFASLSIGYRGPFLIWIDAPTPENHVLASLQQRHEVADPRTLRCSDVPVLLRTSREGRRLPPRERSRPLIHFRGGDRDEHCVLEVLRSHDIVPES